MVWRWCLGVSALLALVFLMFAPSFKQADSPGPEQSRAHHPNSLPRQRIVDSPPRPVAKREPGRVVIEVLSSEDHRPLPNAAVSFITDAGSAGIVHTNADGQALISDTPTICIDGLRAPGHLALLLDPPLEASVPSHGTFRVPAFELAPGEESADEDYLTTRAGGYNGPKRGCDGDGLIASMLLCFSVDPAQRRPVHFAVNTCGWDGPSLLYPGVTCRGVKFFDWAPSPQVFATNGRQYALEELSPDNRRVHLTLGQDPRGMGRISMSVVCAGAPAQTFYFQIEYLTPPRHVANAEGRFIVDVPAGTHDIRAWTDTCDEELQEAVELSQGETVAVTINLSETR